MSQFAQPHTAGPHGADPHTADPHTADPHGTDPHRTDPSTAPAHGAGARPQQAAARPVPVSVRVADPGLVRAQGRPRSGEPVPVRAGRRLRELVSSSAAAEVEAVTGVARDLQQPITTGRQIVVTGIRGGAGKTTVTALLGRVFEHYRHDPVLMVEADPSLGTLPIRLGAETVRWTCADLAQIVDPSMQLTDITGYLVQLPDGGWLLPGSQGTVGARLELAQYRDVMVAVRRYFGITLVDCESLPSELARTALVAAQARVLVTPATLEGVTSTRAILDWMAGVARPRLLPGTVVALVSAAPHLTMDEEAAAAHLRLDGVEVVRLPYDRHLAAGGVIRTGLLGERTREAATRLAAATLNRAVGGRR
ncbi:nucleotide-binding protein [Streptomyces zingiberis]|nr:cellulose synthase operon protein YhjQ/BcsQ [Streptomyces zingiberis]